MIVTIDGPAGAGKSSAARELARRLGFPFFGYGRDVSGRDAGRPRARARSGRMPINSPGWCAKFASSWPVIACCSMEAT